MHVVKAVDQYPSNVSRDAIEKVLSKGRSFTGGLDFEIHIKESARVMLTSNIDISDRLINGQLGTVAKISVNEISGKPSIIYVKFDDDLAGDSLINKSGDLFAVENKVVPIRAILSKIKINSMKTSSPEIQRLQFPLTSAWACTIHKVQGLTLKRIVISFELIKQNTFNYGQIYVALSRATALDGLHVIGKVDKKHIRADPRVCEEYERLRSTSLLEKDVQCHPEWCRTVIPITLLNIRSLRKHSSDIKFDKTIFNCPLILLTETQLLPCELVNDIEDNLCPLILQRQDNDDRFGSLALCHKSTVIINEREYISAINGLKFQATFREHNNSQITFLLLYRKHQSNVDIFITNLGNILDQLPIDVVLGDFNINYLSEKDSSYLRATLESRLHFQQIVEEATFLSSGNLLDHVYVRQNKFKSVTNRVISVYYSDHDGILVNFEV